MLGDSKIPIANYKQAYRLNQVRLQQPMEPYSHGYKIIFEFSIWKALSNVCV